MAGQEPIATWRIRPSTGDLNRYVQVRLVTVATKRNPGHPSTIMCSPGCNSFACRASNRIE